jgi:hypothetical protein
MIARRQVYPVLRLFPIWKYGERYVELGSARVEPGWYLDWFEIRELPRVG